MARTSEDGTCEAAQVGVVPAGERLGYPLTVDFIVVPEEHQRGPSGLGPSVSDEFISLSFPTKLSAREQRTRVSGSKVHHK